MKIQKTETYSITFSVCYFESTEGGMSSDVYGEEVRTIEEAIHLLELAKASKGGYDWIITADVVTTITSK